jgi:type IV pilus assembly protein PilP
MAYKRTLALRLLTCLIAVSALAGCGRTTTSDPNLETYVATIKARPAPPLDPVPVMKTFDNFPYTDQGLRDPFSAPVKKGNSGPSGPDPTRIKQPLEAYPLDGLVMNGTLGSGSSIVALVMSPDKVTHRIVPGNYMGQNDGKVTQVTETKISLTELVPDGAGGWIERPASIALPTQ